MNLSAIIGCGVGGEVRCSTPIDRADGRQRSRGRTDFDRRALNVEQMKVRRLRLRSKSAYSIATGLPPSLEDARSITPREALLHRIPYHRFKRQPLVRLCQGIFRRSAIRTTAADYTYFSSDGRPHCSNSQGSGKPTMPEIRLPLMCSTIRPYGLCLPSPWRE